MFFTNSGTEANEAAFKLTRRTGRTHLVAAEGAFHGRTMGALALTAKAAYREPFEPLPGDVTFVPYGDAEALAAAVTDETAAVVLEPIQGEAGVVVAARRLPRRRPRDHPRPRRAAVARRGPDRHRPHRRVVRPRPGRRAPTSSPSPRASAAASRSAPASASATPAALLEPGNHGTTFGGNPVACAAALAVLDTIEDDGLLEHVTALGAQLRDGLAADPQVTEVAGRGLLLGLDLADETAAAVVAARPGARLHRQQPRPDRLRLAPPLSSPRPTPTRSPPPGRRSSTPTRPGSSHDAATSCATTT